MTLEERFWQKVDKSGECWVWLASKDRHGYGRLTIKTRRKSPFRASHISYEMAHGPISQGMFVCHSCDNPSCVRPEHLFLGTQKQNMDDASAKGRLCRKLTLVDRQEIRDQFATGGISKGELSRRYGVTQRVIQYVIHGHKKAGA